MTDTYLTGYHSCKPNNGYDYIIDNAPFLSGNGRNQWLSQGYYFWTDSDYWAKRWPSPTAQKVITKFNISVPTKDDILDLVGNVNHQEHFVNLIGMIKKTANTKNKRWTVNQIINYLRRDVPNDVFPYLGIKAEDNKKAVENIPFIDPVFNSRLGKYTSPFIGLITRQQLCIFENARDRICLVDVVFPDDFSAKFNSC
ncbi:TPA: hypothetical protein OUB92_003124 [Morganella morganii]|nr:hypothetical protein [Morganella morganii]